MRFISNEISYHQFYYHFKGRQYITSASCSDNYILYINCIHIIHVYIYSVLKVYIDHSYINYLTSVCNTKSHLQPYFWIQSLVVEGKLAGNTVAVGHRICNLTQ